MSLGLFAEFNRRRAREIRISKMTYRELQQEIRQYHPSLVTVRLNNKRAVLETELCRLYQEYGDGT